MQSIITNGNMWWRGHSIKLQPPTESKNRKNKIKDDDEMRKMMIKKNTLMMKMVMMMVKKR